MSWTLGFDDPAVERDYQAAVARAMRRPLAVLSVCGLLVAVASWFTDRPVQHTDANVDVIHLAKLLTVYPAALASLIFVRLPPRLFDRHLQRGLAIALAATLGCNAIAGWILPDPGAVDARIGIEAMVFLTLLGGVIGCRFVYVAPIALITNVAFVAAIATRVPAAGDLGVAIFWELSGVGLAALIAYQAERRDRDAFTAARALATERARSERLLRNVLPDAIAERLKDGVTRIADHFDDATVLFADIVGFTPLAATLTPAALVAALDEVFTEFDALAERHGLEKIKTIGDAYMVVGGVPTPRGDHAEAVAEMALAMRDAIAARSIAGTPLAVRIGIHSGPLVAGVIGKRKFLYDLWGDTVNLASRLESHGLPGEIQLSAETRARLGERFLVAPRGLVAIKGKGELETWLLQRSGA